MDRSEYSFMIAAKTLFACYQSSVSCLTKGVNNLLVDFGIEQASFYRLGMMTQRAHNIEFSCPAASDDQRGEFGNACTAQSGLIGDNCNDLL
jgi:hypothetical protein